MRIKVLEDLYQSINWCMSLNKAQKIAVHHIGIRDDKSNWECFKSAQHVAQHPGLVTALAIGPVSAARESGSESSTHRSAAARRTSAQSRC